MSPSTPTQLATKTLPLNTRQISASSVLTTSTNNNSDSSPSSSPVNAYVHASDSGLGANAHAHGPPQKLGIPSGSPARFSASSSVRTSTSDGFDMSRSSSMTTITDQNHAGPQGGVHEHAQGQVQGLIPGQNVRCGGCKLVIDQSSGGVVVAFGNSLWHTACFRCAKCSTRVTADTNLLLLSDGSPVCSACSYQCFVCKNPITEEAIMTGDESYHAGCFTCRSCSKRIEELVFAKTSQGIYCMACHNERVARSRRHAEAKRARAKKDKEKGDSKPKTGLSSSTSGDRQTSLDLNGSTQSRESEHSYTTSSTASSSASEYSTNTLRNGFPSPTSTIGQGRFAPSPAPSSPFLTPGPTPNSAAGGSVQQVTRGPLGEHGTQRSHEKERSYESDKEREREREREWQSRRDASPSPSPSQGSRTSGRGGREMDDTGSTPNLSSSGYVSSPAMDFSPSNVSDTFSSADMPTVGKRGSGLGLGVGLGVPGATSKADKRRSMNPGAWNQSPQHQPQQDKEPPSAPSTSSMESSNGRMSPLPPSPLRASFTDIHEDFGSPRSSPTKQANLGWQQPYKSSGNGRQSPRAAYESPSIQEERSTTPGSSSGAGGPPRSSSLADSMNAAASRPVIGNRAQSHDRAASPALRLGEFGQRSVTSAGESIASKLGESTQLRDRSVSVGADAPKLETPSLPSLHFSLSDPDFALMLQDGKSQSQSPTSAQPRTPDVEKPVTPSTAGGSTDSGSTMTGRTRMKTLGDRVEPLSKPFARDNRSASLPTSPVAGASPPVLLDSPPRDTPSKFSLSETSASQVDPIPSFYRTSSNDDDVFQSMSNLTLGMRQESAESTNSLAVPHRDGHSSMLPVLQALLASSVSGSETVSLKASQLLAAVREMEALHSDVSILRGKYSGAKRTSQHYIEGMSVATEEYEKETTLRLAAEAEVNRLRAQVHDKTARLSLMAGDERRQETLQRRSRDLVHNLSGLEKDISKLKAERDITLAEVVELGSVREDDGLKNAPVEEKASSLSRSLTNRLNSIKDKYKDELEPLTAQREALGREIAELRETRNSYLEESAALSAKNDELADLNSRLTRQAEVIQDSMARNRPMAPLLRGSGNKQHMSGSPSMSSIATSTTTLQDNNGEDYTRMQRPGKSEMMENAPQRNKFKWYKSSKGPDVLGSSASLSKPLGLPNDKNRGRPSHESSREHIFQQHTILRFSKCEHCGDKMWGMQELRCAVCGIVCHSKCSEKLHITCSAPLNPVLREELPEEPPGPSMFGRDLSEQVKLDGQAVPTIITKCIQAVEEQAMDYEGVYRKTGGSSQSKKITQLFDRGDYEAFDLNDMDEFNDINSTTSVMKSYLRSLPNPLLTHDLHESFVAAASNRDMDAKQSELTALVAQLPKEHYDTLRFLMLHLNRVKNHSPTNLMSSRNLGVVFGPTLMRSADPSREFGDMAGKALSIEWLVDNAPRIFT